MLSEVPYQTPRPYVLTSNKPVTRAASPDMVTIPARELLALRDEIEELRAFVDEVRATTGAELRLVAALKLTPREGLLLGLLMKRPVLTRQAIVLHLFDARPYDAPAKGIDVLVWKLRPKLRRHGVDIETITGTGYRLAPGGLARLEALAGGVAS